MLVVSAEKKQVSSTAGMQTSVQTSSLMAHRVADVVPQRMAEMERAIAERDFHTFATLTMQVLFPCVLPEDYEYQYSCKKRCCLLATSSLLCVSQHHNTLLHCIDVFSTMITTIL